MFDSITLNETDSTVSRDGHAVHLTPFESMIFKPLYAAGGAQISRDDLLEKAYPGSLDGAKYTHWKFNSAKVILSRLRRKLIGVGLIIETEKRWRKSQEGMRTALYRLVDMADKPVTYPKAEEKAA